MSRTRIVQKTYDHSILILLNSNIMNDNFIYTEDGKTIIIVKNNSITPFSVPDEYSSFGLFDHLVNKEPKNVSIPNGVETIMPHAFEGCKNIKSIRIPESVTQMGGWTFKDCESLETAHIGKGLTAIENCSFHNCTNLKTATLPEKLHTIGDFAFSGCAGLKSVEIPDSMSKIGKYAFGDSWQCCSGQKTRLWDVSHNSQLTGVRSKWGDVYCGKTSADDAFAKWMFIITFQSPRMSTIYVFPNFL